MRIWHVELIPYLPRSQLLAQWRELNSIYKKKNKHILINYIYNYSKDYLYVYSIKVIEELKARKYKVNQFTHFNKYFDGILDEYGVSTSLRYREHNNDYLTICYYNLKEKYIRGQKDFTTRLWHKLESYYKSRIEGEK